MEYRNADGIYVVSIARGEEIIESIQRLIEKENISLASVQGIGAAEDIELGYYNVNEQQYSTKVFRGEFEIANLSGSITTMNGDPYVHLHITIGDKEFTAHAGHLVRAIVSGACEIFVHTLPGTVDRKKDEAVTGLNLLNFL